MLGRKSRSSMSGKLATTALAQPVVEATIAPPRASVIVPESKPARYSALVLVADDFLHRQLDDLFSSAGEDWSWERAATVVCARQLCEQKQFSIMLIFLNDDEVHADDAA